METTLHSKRPKVSSTEISFACFWFRLDEAIQETARGNITPQELDEIKTKIEKKVIASFYEWVRTYTSDNPPKFSYQP